MNRFAEFSARKTRAAQEAPLYPLRTIADSAFLHATVAAGNDWSRRLYDGPFHLWRIPPIPRPAVSLVFVQSSEGNTGAERPADLGGGETDQHLIYEGLSRVAADAILAGAATAGGPDVFFSVWHPELVALRKSLGLPRHPAQVIVTGRGHIDVDASLIFNVPDVRVFVLGTLVAREALAAGVEARPWVTLLTFDGNDLAPALEHLRTEYGIRRLSAVGGRKTAGALLDAGVVQDVYLTTTTISAGQPETPLFAGTTRLDLDPVVRKRCTDPKAPFLFEHLAVYKES